jgi:hypothetical protein
MEDTRYMCRFIYSCVCLFRDQNVSWGSYCALYRPLNWASLFCVCCTMHINRRIGSASYIIKLTWCALCDVRSQTPKLLYCTVVASFSTKRELLSSYEPILKALTWVCCRDQPKKEPQKLYTDFVKNTQGLISYVQTVSVSISCTSWLTLHT